MKIQALNNRINFQNNKYNYSANPAFTSGGKVIDEGDYVKIPKEKYERDKFWKRVDYVVLAGFIAYCLYQIFKKGGHPPSV